MTTPICLKDVERDFILIPRSKPRSETTSDEYAPILVDANVFSDDDIAVLLCGLSDSCVLTDGKDAERYRKAGHALAQVAFDRGLLGTWITKAQEVPR